jgi:hypothetical protein
VPPPSGSCGRTQRWRGDALPLAGEAGLHEAKVASGPSLAFSKHLLGDKPARKCRKTLSPPQGGEISPALAFLPIPDIDDLQRRLRRLYLPPCGGESDFSILAGAKRRLSARNRKRGALPGAAFRRSPRGQILPHPAPSCLAPKKSPANPIPYSRFATHQSLISSPPAPPPLPSSPSLLREPGPDRGSGRAAATSPFGRPVPEGLRARDRPEPGLRLVPTRMR